jgi:hypothetical protein
MVLKRISPPASVGHVIAARSFCDRHFQSELAKAQRKFTVFIYVERFIETAERQKGLARYGLIASRSRSPIDRTKWTLSDGLQFEILKHARRHAGIEPKLRAIVDGWKVARNFGSCDAQPIPFRAG